MLAASSTGNSHLPLALNALFVRSVADSRSDQATFFHSHVPSRPRSFKATFFQSLGASRQDSVPIDRILAVFHMSVIENG
jgi:hypothetical protein